MFYLLGINDISDLKVIQVVTALFITWTDLNNNYCNLEYQVRIYDNDIEDLIVDEPVTEQQYIFENAEYCSTYIIRIYAKTNTSMTSNTLSSTVTIGKNVILKLR